MREIIKGTAGNDSLSNAGDNAVIYGLGGNDSIENFGDSVSISGGAGNDSVWSGSAVVWLNRCDNVTIDGGNGDDYIFNNGYDLLVNYSGGNDIIDGFDRTSTLQIAAGKMNSVVNSNGYDYFLTVGESIITLKGAASLDKVNIVNSKGKAVKFKTQAVFNFTDSNDSLINYFDNVTIDAKKGNDTIDNSGANVLFKYSGGNDLIDGFNETSTLQIASGKMNSVVTSNGEDYFLTIGKNTVTLTGAAEYGKASIVNAKGKAIKYRVQAEFDTANGADNVENYLEGVTISAGAGNDWIRNYGSKVLINGDAGDDDITVYSTSKWNDETLSYEDIAPVKVTINGGAGNDDIVNMDGNNITIDGGTGNNRISNYGSKVLFKCGNGNDYISGFNETSTLQIAAGKMNSVVSSYGNDYFLEVGKNTITLEGAANLDKVNIVNAKGKAVEFTVKPLDALVNRKKFANIKGTADRDIIQNYGYKVKVNGGAGNDIIFNYGNNSTIAGGSGNDSIKNYSANVTITGGAGSDIINNTNESALPGAHGEDSVFMSGGAGDDSIYNSGSYATILGGKGNDNISNGGHNLSVDGGSGNDYIWNSGLGVTISGGAGDDYIYNMRDGLTIKYNAGDGNDSIYGLNSTDTLSISGGTYSTTKSGADTVVAVGNGKIKLSGDSSVNIYGIKKTSSTLTLTNKTKSPVKLDSKTETVDASARTKGVQITGNKLGNMIFGGAGKDTLYGGKGNDSLWGNAGADKFIYASGDGKDIIYGFDDKDTLTLDGIEFTSASYNKRLDAVTMKFNGGSIMLKDFTATTFHIGNDTYKISGSRFVKK